MQLQMDLSRKPDFDAIRKRYAQREYDVRLAHLRKEAHSSVSYFKKLYKKSAVSPRWTNKLLLACSARSRAYQTSVGIIFDSVLERGAAWIYKTMKADGFVWDGRDWQDTEKSLQIREMVNFFG